MTIEKYARRAKNDLIPQSGRYEIFNLEMNPFPSSPFVNPESTDARNNGKIYETSIREQEYRAIEENFLKVPQSDSNHLRLGYIMDTSYIGRGNGKTAFLTNLQRKINKDFGFSISDETNKCFAITVVPEPSGKTKTFENFVDLCANKIFDSNIIEDCLVSLRLIAISDLYDDFNAAEHFPDEETIKNKLQSLDWYKENNIDYRSVTQQILSSVYLQALPQDFPLYYSNSLVFSVIKQDDFIEYYKNLKRGTPRIEFIFSHLVNFFLAAGFNGAYVFVDDFERIPDFQSERQKRDFAVELRTCLFDGLSTNAKVGFYNFIIVLHAGVPPMIQSAWEQAGLEHRSPIFFKGTPKNVIRFEKIRVEDAHSLIQKYLQYYRVSDVSADNFFPFTKEAIGKLAELNDFNASKILKMAYEVLERAVEQNAQKIDIEFIQSIDEAQLAEQPGASGISEANTKDLMKEA
jgi:hypothetical protein